MAFLLVSASLAGLGPERFKDRAGRLYRPTGPREGNQVVHLHFFFHDIVSGRTPSAVRVAQAAGSDSSPTLFGIVMMADDPLTEGPELTSRLVGRAQGLYGSAGQEELALIMAMDFGFTDGEFNGSSFSLLGRNSALRPVREMAVVGGTGVFRLARGVATAKTYSINATTGDPVVEYNVIVVIDSNSKDIY